MGSGDETNLAAACLPCKNSSLVLLEMGSEEDKQMLNYERITSLVLIILLAVHVGHCLRDQAPGDGDAICTEEFIDRMTNPFFANRPAYSASERPLMDSRDYNRLLQESGDAYVPWQSIDRDNNNTNDVITEVK